MKNKIYFGFVSLSLMTTLSAFADVSEGSFSVTNRDFKELFNEHRFSQPENTPWAGSYWAFGRDGLAAKDIAEQSDQTENPAARFDRIFNKNDKAVKWELENHSCGIYKDDPETKTSCESWWGHCNAWAAAAVKEPEPIKSLQYKGEDFTIADLKGYLTEIWMESDALFAGETDKEMKTSNWILNRKQMSYKSFWDPSPTAFFYIFTNYVGMMKTGVVIDRFTGDEVWNQPIVGYRILPIRKADILETKERNGKTIYPVLVRMKIYWANDEVAYNHVSEPFQIEETSDRETLETSTDYTSRLIKFRLYFDSPLEMKSTTKVEAAGRIVGGVWEHQLEARSIIDSLGIEAMNETHPDFIWQPTDLMDSQGQSNPYVDPSTVRAIIQGE